MIHRLNFELRGQRKDDHANKDYCDVAFHNKAEDKKKGIEHNFPDLETAVDDANEAFSTTKTEIEALDDGLRALDEMRRKMLGFTTSSRWLILRRSAPRTARRH